MLALERENAALDSLTSSVMIGPILMHPDLSKPFLVVSDASDYGVRASMEQVSDRDARRRPVAFFSHKLNRAERGYRVHERELISIVPALRKWRHLLYGSDFTVACKTDHRPLQHCLTQAILSPTHVRWQQYLSEYSLSVEYVQGSANRFADGLLRRSDLRLMMVGASADIDTFLVSVKNGYQHDSEARKLLAKVRAGARSSCAYRILHGV